MAAKGERKTILLVEDDKKVRDFNKFLLEEQGFIVEATASITEAWGYLERRSPDAIVLDVGLPDGNGIVFLRTIRERGIRTPVLMLTGYNEESHIVKAYEGGCDDYLTKPYTFGVLLVHIKKLLENAEKVPEYIEKGALKLDILNSRAYINGVDMNLSQKEYLLLFYLARNEGRTITAEKLYENVWKMPMAGDNNSLKNMVYRLRKKLEEEDSGVHIAMSRGEGYCFEYVK